LPRQARDSHRETALKKDITVFSGGPIQGSQGKRKNVFCDAIFNAKRDHFAKTGSGQTQERPQTGGEVPVFPGANNYPLRSGKFSSFEGGMRVRKRSLFCHLYIHAIFLPRQARDKHRETALKNRLPFSQVNAFLGGGFIPAAQRGTRTTQLMHVCDIWCETTVGCFFYC
jgi:hypothetical protein